MKTGILSSDAAGQATFREATSSPKHYQNDVTRTFQAEQLLRPVNSTDSNRPLLSTVDDTSRVQRIRRGELFPIIPTMPVPKEKFWAMQKWEGHVTEVSQDTFWARLVCILGEGPDQEAEIYSREVDQEDRALIVPGAVFYWSIGYLDRPSGRMRTSIIRFRRLRPWSKRDVEAADIEAQRLKALLSPE